MTCKSRIHEFCIINPIGTKRCRCFNCNNDARNSNGKPDGCRCGEGDKNIRVHAPMCRINNDPNALAILMLDRVPRKDVNATASRTPLAKERQAGKIFKLKKVSQMYIQSFAIKKETRHGFLERKQLLH